MKSVEIKSQFNLPDIAGLPEEIFQPLAKQIFERHFAAIEACLDDLVTSGVGISRIRLLSRPDGSTAVQVDGVPYAEFRIADPAGPRA